MITPQQVIAARKAAGLTQEGAAMMIGAKRRTWQCWERGERNCPPAKFNLFLLTTGVTLPV